MGASIDLVGMLLRCAIMGSKSRILFLCKGNSARSQMAEAIARHIGSEYFEVSSAGPSPLKPLHPMAIETLARNRVPADGLAPKDLSTYDAQTFHFVVCLCERDREEATQIPGADIIRWSFPDPEAFPDEATRKRAYDELFHGLEARIRLLIAVTHPKRPRFLNTDAAAA